MKSILGAMLSHDNATWSSYIGPKTYEWDSDDVLMSYLPLSHIAALMIDTYFAATVGAAVAYADKEALRGTLVSWKKLLLTLVKKLFSG